MKNKGVSPLISWILLVGMTISIGSMVYFWATNFARNINIDNTDNSIYCDNVALKLISSCRDGSRLNLNITNSGSYNITTMTFTRTTELFPTASCVVFNEPPLAPGRMLNYSFDLSSDITTNSTEIVICPNNPRVDTNDNALDFNVIPWITVSNEDGQKDIACSDRKLSLGNVNMNSLCSNLVTSFSLSNVVFPTVTTCNGPYNVSFRVTNNAARDYMASPQLNIYNSTALTPVIITPMSIPAGQYTDFTANIDSFIPSPSIDDIFLEISVIGDVRTSSAITCS